MASEVTEQPAGQWTQEQFSSTYWKARQANGGEHLSEESMAWLLKKRGLPHIPYYQKFLDEGRFAKKTAADALNQRGDQYVPFLGAAVSSVETLSLLSDAKAVEAGTATPEQEEAIWRYQIDMLRPKSGWYKFWDLITDLPAPAIEFAAGGAGAARLLGTGIKEAAEAQAKSTIRKKLAEFGIRAAISGAARVPGEAAQRALNAGGLHLEEDDVDPDKLNLVFAAKTGEFLDYVPEGIVSQAWETASELSGALFAGKVAKADVFAHIVRYLQVKTFGAAAARQGSRKAWEALNKLGYQGGGLSEALEEVVGGLGRAASDLIPGLDMEETVRGAFPEDFQDGLIQYLAFSVPGAVGTTVGLAAADPTQFTDEHEGGVDPQSGQDPGQGPSLGTTVPRGTPVEPSEAFAEAPKPTAGESTYVQPAPSQEVLADVEAFAPGGTVVEPTPELAAAARGAREMGTEVTFVQPGEAGAVSKGASIRPGSILVDVTKARPDTIIAHEIVHDISRSSGMEFQALMELVQRVAPREMEAWRRFHRARGGADALRAQEPGGKRRALRAEETFADYASSLPSVIEFMATAEGEKLAKRIAQRDRALWERLWDTLRRLVGQSAAVDRDAQQRLLDDLQRMGQMTGREVSQADVHVARLLSNTMSWVARSREAGSPRVQSPPPTAPGGGSSFPENPGPIQEDPAHQGFAPWFADSKVTDEAGAPRVVYHGSRQAFTSFDQGAQGTANDSGWLGSGFYFTNDPERAHDYTRGGPSEEGASIYPAYLSLQNPLEVTETKGAKPGVTIREALGLDPTITPGAAGTWVVPPSAVTEAAKAQGYDGIVFTYPNGEQEFVAYEPTQVKSATGNRGTFSGAESDIRMSPEEKKPVPPGLMPPAPFAGGKPPAGATDAVRRAYALGAQPREQRANISGDENVRNYMDALDVARNNSGQPYRDSVADWEKQADRAMAEVNHAGLSRHIMDAISERGVLDPVETVIARRLSADAVARALATGSVEAHKEAVQAGWAYRESGAAWGRAGVARQDRWPKTAREELADILSQETTRQRRYFNRLTRLKRAVADRIAKSEAMKRSQKLRREIASIERELAALRSGEEVDARMSPEEGSTGPAPMSPEERAKRIKALEARLAKARQELASVSLSPEEQLLEKRLAEVTSELDREMERDAKRMVQAVQKLHEEGIDPALVITSDLQDPATRRRIAEASTGARSDGWDWFLAWRYNSMLSWAGTHARNVAGNTLNTVMEQGLQRAAEGLIAGSLRKATGKAYAESASMGEFRVMFPVFGRAMREGMRNAWTAYTSGMPATEMSQQKNGIPIEGAESKIEQASVRAFPSKKILYLDYLGTRALQAMDDFAKTFISIIETEAIAYRMAKAKGYEPGTQEFMEARAQLLESGEVRQKAMDAAAKTTFQEKPGNIGQYLLTGRAMVDAQLGMPMGSVLLPFVTTPINIFKAGLRKVPPITVMKMVIKGIARKRGKSWGYKTEDQAFVTDAADLLVGAGLFWAISAFMMGDGEDDVPLITGSSDGFGSKRDLQYRTYPPLSFRLGDQWYSYSGLEPLATFLAPAVDAVDAWWIAAESGDAEQIAAAASAIGNSVLSSVQDKTFLRTVGELYQAITNPEYTSSAQFARDTLVTPMVPNVLRGAMRESDDVYRLNTFKPDGETTPWGMLLTGDLRAWGPVLPAPGAPWTPPPKRDVWGRPIVRPVQLTATSLTVLPHLLKEAVPLSQMSPIERADLAMRAWNLKVLRGQAGDDAELYYPPTPKVSKDWTPAEVDRLVLEAGTMAANRVRGIPMDIDDPTERQIELIKKAISRSYSQVRDRIRKERRASQ